MQGAEPLVEVVNRAVAAGDAERIVDQLRGELCGLISAGTMPLPELLRACCGDHYARRLVHRDPERGYSIVAMTWGPHQTTGLHDHAGLWCVEGVWQGSIEVLQYELVEERAEQRCRFEKRGSIRAGKGSAGCLIPPHEHHVIRNPADEPAVSIHVYGGDMNFCHVFEERGDGWYERRGKALGFDG
jgi:3-mercaptopropionate dioxygenase